MRIVSLVPCPHPRHPAADVPAVFLILRAECLAQVRLLIQPHKQNHAQRRQAHPYDRGQTCPSEDYPQPHPTHTEPEVHGVPHVTIEPHHYQLRRRSDRRRRSVSCPSEVPHAPQRHRKTEHRGHGRNPAPSRHTRRVDPHAPHRGEQPEPQRKECSAHGQGSDGGWPVCAPVIARHRRLRQHPSIACARVSLTRGSYFETSFRLDASTAGTRGRRNGTIAPLEGSAAAVALARTSFWMYCTNSWIRRCISSMRSRICRMMAMPLMLTPRSRASDRMNSSRCKSSSV